MLVNSVLTVNSGLTMWSTGLLEEPASKCLFLPMTYYHGSNWSYRLQDLGIELRNRLRNWKDVWDRQNSFCNSVSIECESIAIRSLCVTIQEKNVNRFAILWSYCLGFRFVVVVLNAYSINICIYTVDVPLLKWWQKKKKEKNSGEGVRFALYLCQEWFHTP